MYLVQEYMHEHEKMKGYWFHIDVQNLKENPVYDLDRISQKFNIMKGTDAKSKFVNSNDWQSPME